jgi:carboxyl-terminal processing protease
MDRKNILLFGPIIVALAIVTGIFIGRFYKKGTQSPQFYIYPNTNKVSNVINYVANEYVDPVDKTQLIENTIPLMLSDLDPHSQYIPARELKTVNEPLEGNFSGIGIQFKF